MPDVQLNPDRKLLERSAGETFLFRVPVSSNYRFRTPIFCNFFNLPRGCQIVETGNEIDERETVCVAIFRRDFLAELFDELLDVLPDFEQNESARARVFCESSSRPLRPRKENRSLCRARLNRAWSAARRSFRFPDSGSSSTSQAKGSKMNFRTRSQVLRAETQLLEHIGHRILDARTSRLQRAPNQIHSSLSRCVYHLC